MFKHKNIQILKMFKFENCSNLNQILKFFKLKNVQTTKNIQTLKFSNSNKLRKSWNQIKIAKINQ
jgi:hypothetical protein